MSAERITTDTSMRKRSLFTKKQNLPYVVKPEANEPAAVTVKRIILNIAGDFSTEPSALQESIDLRRNLQFKDNEYRLLQIRLDEFVQTKKEGATVSTDEANGCSTVGDCISIAESKLAA
jgi:hypothetical protein